jgi:hypothetical protein
LTPVVEKGPFYWTFALNNACATKAAFATCFPGSSLDACIGPALEPLNAMVSQVQYGLTIPVGEKSVALMTYVPNTDPKPATPKYWACPMSYNGNFVFMTTSANGADTICFYFAP